MKKIFIAATTGLGLLFGASAAQAAETFQTVFDSVTTEPSAYSSSPTDGAAKAAWLHCFEDNADLDEGFRITISGRFNSTHPWITIVDVASENAEVFVKFRQFPTIQVEASFEGNTPTLSCGILKDVEFDGEIDDEDVEVLVGDDD